MTESTEQVENLQRRTVQHRERHGDPRPTDALPPISNLGDDSPVPVLMIVGTGRSGSTLLADVLATTLGFAHAGELRYVWQRGFLENRHCSCGDPFDTCAFWADVRAQMGAGGVEPAEIAARLKEATRIRTLFGAFKGADRAAALEQTAALYRAFRHVSGCEVIIDSSKLPPYGRLLDRDHRFDVHVVHLVRDPRGVVFSWGSRKATPDTVTGQMMQMTPQKASALWTLWNGLTLGWWRGADNYTMVRYEDLVSEPVATIGRIVEELGRGTANVVQPAAGEVGVGANYGIAGNPDRFERSSRKVRLDTRWKEELSPWKKRLTTAMTAPLLSRFRYPVRT